MAHDAYRFFGIFIDIYSTTLFHHKKPTYESYEYEKEGSDTGLNRKQGLVETDSSVIINFDMFN